MSISTLSVGIEESVVTIGTRGAELVGVLAQPTERHATKAVGVVIVVGGPQTRVGSHRQFVLMARALAQAGYPCLRFDYTGMGDSPGPRPDFERAAPDVRRACDALVAQAPGCTKIALWGLCDGATAALLYAPGDERVAAVIAANPWARSDATRSAVLVSDHYGLRLRSAEFWKKLLTGKVNVPSAAREALGHMWRARTGRTRRREAGSEDLPTRLVRTLAVPRQMVRLQLSGRDLTAAEFGVAVRRSGKSLHNSISVLHLDNADHTFSAAEAWEAVLADTSEQLGRL